MLQLSIRKFLSDFLKLKILREYNQEFLTLFIIEQKKIMILLVTLYYIGNL